MIKVGLSGTRFSGKNKVADVFSKIGIPVFDADLVIRFILTNEYKVIGSIRDKIGHKYFRFGVLNIEKVKEDRKFDEVLNIVEPLVFDAYDKFAIKNKESIYTIFNSSILYERGWHDKMYNSISVYAPYIDRVARARKLSNTTFDDFIKIDRYMNKEDDEMSKNNFADHVIHNYNEFDIINQVNKIDQILIDYYLDRT